MRQGWTHIHLGAGSLGLGFVAHLTAKAGFKVILANRSGDAGSLKKTNAIKENRSYLLHIWGQTQREETVQVDTLLFTDTEEHLLYQRVCDPSTVLLTTALKDGLHDSVSLIRAMIQARVTASIKSPLFIIACENIVDSNKLMSLVKNTPGIKNSQRRDFDKGIKFVPCVVDRICSKVVYDDDLDSVRVNVEPYARWVIERTEGIEILEEQFMSLVERNLVEFVPDIRPYKMRKLWLVNGPHLVAAILSKAVREERLEVFLRDPTNEAIMRRVQAEFGQALLMQDNAFSAMDLANFSEGILKRFQDYPDSFRRIMSRFNRTTLEGFLKDMYLKVVEPARVLLDRRGAKRARWITHSVYEALRMIEAGDYLAP